jgi:dihydrofolate reductase
VSITVIVAMARNRVIGRDGGLPWRLPADLARFKRLTMGHTLLMGQRTYDSIGRPLPGRRTVVMSLEDDFAPAGVTVARSLESALAAVASDDQVFVAGGGEIYRLLLPHADAVLLTLVEHDVEGDTTFPELDPETWELVEDRPRAADERNPHAMRFQRYERRGSSLS